MRYFFRRPSQDQPFDGLGVPDKPHRVDWEQRIKFWGIVVALVGGVVSLLVAIGLWTPPAASADAANKAHDKLIAQMRAEQDPKLQALSDQIKSLTERQLTYEVTNEAAHTELRAAHNQTMQTLLGILGQAANAPSGPRFQRGRPIP